MVNVARYLPEQANRVAAATALRVPQGRTRDGAIIYQSLNFRQLNLEADAWARQLERAGAIRGQRILLMVTPGLPLVAICFALFKTGAVPVVIDPGMGIRKFLRAVQHTRPTGLVGISLAIRLSRIFFPAFRSVQYRLKVNPSKPLLPAVLPDTFRPDPFPVAATAADDPAAIVFTSGSTGSPKGVCYEHGMFMAQVDAIRNQYDILPGEVDLPMLPIFSLFNPALGMTTIVPEMNPSRPATVDPAKIVQAIQQCDVTNSFGSPVLWRKIASYCLENNIRLHSLRRVLMAGAPVSPKLFSDLRKVIPNGHGHSPYGATEALPVSSIMDLEVVGGEGTAHATREGRGTCVGTPAPGIDVRVIRITEGPLGHIMETSVLEPMEVGEIIVSGPVVTKTYDGLPEATRDSKISGENNVVWHRMGDTGYLDEKGRLWFCGRKAEMVALDSGTFHTDCCEGVFLAHESVQRVALIAWSDSAGRFFPALVVEPKDGCWPAGRRRQRAFAEELLALGQTVAITRPIERFFFAKTLPVDVRHNAKIHRLTLTRTLARRRPVRISPKQCPVP